MDSPPPVPAHTCQNCGHEVLHKFCPACGQALQLNKRTIWLVISDFLAHSFAYDGRFWRTILPLVGRPGWLTEQNLRERWVSFLPPVRVFLVISVVFFLTLSWTLPDVTGAVKFNGESPEQVADVSEVTPFSSDFVLGDYLNGLLQKRIEKLNEMEPGERERAYTRELMSAVPTVLFLALPLMALGLKGLYLFRRRLYFEHFVYATHFYSAWLLILIPSIIVNEEWLWFGGQLIYMPLYLFLSMKRVYRQHWFATIAKMTLLGIWQIFSFALLAILVAIIALLAL